jgi:hypothetical protein
MFEASFDDVPARKLLRELECVSHTGISNLLLSRQVVLFKFECMRVPGKGYSRNLKTVAAPLPGFVRYLPR